MVADLVRSVGWMRSASKPDEALPVEVAQDESVEGV
jgi:hypothetical protein